MQDEIKAREAEMGQSMDPNLERQVHSAGRHTAVDETLGLALFH